VGGGWDDGEMGRRGDGETGRRGDGETGSCEGGDGRKMARLARSIAVHGDGEECDSMCKNRCNTVRGKKDKKEPRLIFKF